MMQTIIRHPRLTVHVRTGGEGPKHDPYHFTEYVAETPQGRTTLHEGLGAWIACDGEMQRAPVGFSDEQEHSFLTSLFEQRVGYTPDQLWRIHRRLSSRCRACGGTNFRDVSGFPGETLTICCDCGHVVGSTFNVSAVE